MHMYMLTLNLCKVHSASSDDTESGCLCERTDFC